MSCGATHLANRCYVCGNEHSRDLVLRNPTQNTDEAVQVVSQGCFYRGFVHPVGQTVPAISKLTQRNANDLFSKVTAFLTLQEEVYFALAGKAFALALREANLDLKRFTHSFAESLEVTTTSPQGTLVQKSFDSLPFDDAKSFNATLKTLIGHIQIDRDDTSVIRAHEQIAKLITGFSSRQMEQFFNYLVTTELTKGFLSPWVGIRALQAYRDFPQFDQALERFLEYATEKFICSWPTSLRKGNGRVIFSQIVIDPRVWFGFHENPYSFLHRAESNPTIPRFLMEAIYKRIAFLKDQAPRALCEVDLQGRLEAAVPHNFMLSLAQRLADKRIFIQHNGNFSIMELSEPQYGFSLHALSWDNVIEEENRARLQSE